MLRRAPSLQIAVVCLPLLVAAAVPAGPPSAALGLAASVALLAAVLAGGHAVARRLLPASAPAASRWSAAAVAATALLVLPAIALGHWERLDPRLYLVAEGILAVVLTAALALRGRRREAAEGDPDADHQADLHAAEKTGETAAEDASPSPFARHARRWERALVVAAFALAAGALGVAMDDELADPVQKLDDPSYHMITVATWVQYGDLRMPHFQYGDGATAFYPFTGEVIGWASMAPLRTSDFVARWAQLPYFFALLVAVAAVARRLGASPATAAVAALLLTSVRRLFPYLSLSAANDVMEAFFVVAAVDATLAWAAARRLRSAGGHRFGAAAYLGGALGLMVGTKYLGVLLAPPVLLGALLVVVTGLGRRTGHGGVHGGSSVFNTAALDTAALALAGAVATVVGGYTYLRNWVSVGNPIFPVPLEALGFPGWEETTLAFRSTLPEFAIEPLGFLVSKASLTGLPYYLTLLPAAVLAPLLCLAWRRRGAEAGPATPLPHRALQLWVLLLPAVLYVLFVLRVYDHRGIRYLFAAFALAAVAFAWTVARLPAAWRPPLRAATALAVCAGLVLQHSSLSPHQAPQLPLDTASARVAAAVVFAAACLLGPALVRRLPALRRPAVAWVLLAAALIACLDVASDARAYAGERYADDPVVAMLERGAPDGTRVLVFGGNRWYDLFGSRLQNRVIPAQARHGAVHYHWGDADLRQPAARSTRRWRHVLREGDWLVVYPGQGGADARRWLEKRRLGFEWVAADHLRELWLHRGWGDGGGAAGTAPARPPADGP